MYTPCSKSSIQSLLLCVFADAELSFPCSRLVADALLEALVEEWRTADDAWFSWSSQEGEDGSASLFHRVITELPAAVDAMKAIKRVAKAHKGRTGENVKPSALMLPLRWALTGMDKGASLSVILALLGRDVCLARIRAAVAC